MTDCDAVAPWMRRDRVVPLAAAAALSLASACRSSTPNDTGALAPDARVVGIDATSDGASDAAPPKPKTVVRVHYPAAGRTITLRGSSAPWSWETGATLSPGPDDTWTLETDALTTPAEWKPLLDDTTWSRGPNYRVEPGATFDVWPHFEITKGKVEKRWPSFASSALGTTRAIWVYLPPTYVENPRARFPVVYMHDGQNLFDPALAFGGNEWRVDETLDAAAEDGSIREAIVVGPENGGSARIAEYTPTADATYGGGKGDAYLRFLIEELKPVVDAELRSIPDRESTAVVGSSLGGLISAYAGAEEGGTFALVGALSPSTWWDDRVTLGIVSASKDAPARPLRVYVDSGDAGASKDDVANTAELAATYRAIGYTDGVSLKYVVQPGATHSEVYWAARLPGALAFLLGPRP